MRLKANPDVQAVFATEPKQRRRLAYIASPYGHADKRVVENRVMDTKSAVCHLERIPSLKPYSPILDTLDMERRGNTPREGFYVYDMCMLSKADIFIVLKLDGYKESIGVFCEICTAIALGTPIFYLTLQEIIDGEGILFA